MILRRLSQSLKEQNWTAIWIEFILLVSGVFLGIQVSNWNQAQKDSQRSRVIVENLYTDYTVIAAEGKENIGQVNESIKAVDEVLLLLRNPQIDNDSKVFLAELDQLFSLPAALQESATAQELKFSGRLGLVENNKLRALLVRNSAQLANAQFSQQQRREFVRPYVVPVARFQKLLIEGYPVQQAVELAGGKPAIQIGLHTAKSIYDGELNSFEQSLSSLHVVLNKLDEQRDVGKRP